VIEEDFLMPITMVLQEAETFEVETYKKPKDFKQFRETHVAFSGSPFKHPYDAEKMILVADPYSTNTFYYEFRADTVSFVEELPSIVNLDGETVMMARIWVKKKSVAVRCSPFVVEDLRLADKQL
jgi:hypothetical protein